MALFDSLSKKIIDRSPSSFAEVANAATFFIEAEDLPQIGSAVEREAFAGVMIGLLAITQNETTKAWTIGDLDYIKGKTQMGVARLSPGLKDWANKRFKQLCFLTAVLPDDGEEG